MTYKSNQTATNLLVSISVIIGLMVPAGWTQDNNESKIKLSSPLPNLNKLLTQKTLPLALSTIPLSDDHPQKKVAIKISVRGSQEKIETFITYTLKLGWLKKVNYQIVIIDYPTITKEELKFGNLSEIRTYFSNNIGQNRYGWPTTAKKATYFYGPEKTLPPALLADLQRIYDLAIKALLNQDDDSIHQIIHQLALDDFFQKHQLVSLEDVKTASPR